MLEIGNVVTLIVSSFEFVLDERVVGLNSRLRVVVKEKDILGG
jgi:hypothetical protein